MRTLRNAVEQGKVHHAYLFVGSRGTGKTSMAKILAALPELRERAHDRALRDLRVVHRRSPARRRWTSSRWTRRRTTRSTTSATCARAWPTRRCSGGYKVYILDEAHMLSSQAWNAFLKTLEEPPPQHDLRPRHHRGRTRCCRRSSTAATASTSAGRRWSRSRPSSARRRRRSRSRSARRASALLARHATGSFRDALGTLEQLVTYSRHARSPLDDVLAVLGVADADLLFGGARRGAGGNAREALLAVHRVAESGRDIAAVRPRPEAHARDLLVVQTLGEVPAAARGDPRPRRPAGRAGRARPRRGGRPPARPAGRRA